MRFRGNEKSNNISSCFNSVHECERWTGGRADRQNLRRAVKISDKPT